MSKTVRVNEYYNLFDIYDDVFESMEIPDTIKSSNEYNSFRGFNNFPITDASSSIQPYNGSNSQYQEITGKHKSPQANSPLFIVNNGNAAADILCYPPNVSVPYWSRIIFRNFDYTINTSSTNTFSHILTYTEKIDLSTSDLEFDLQGAINTTTEGSPNYSFNNCTISNGNGDFNGTITKWDKANVFLKFDEYPSRSKVIFSSCDKTRNPDIEFNFGYHKGQMEPIKLNLSLSAGIPINNTYASSSSYKYNQSLTYNDLERVFKSCYWCIEWICDKDAGN